MKKSHLLIGAAIATMTAVNAPKVNAQVNDSSKAVVENFEINKNDYNILLNTEISELSLEQIRYTMLKYINTMRKNIGVEPLILDSQLNEFSQDYSQYLFENNMDDIITKEDHKNKEGKTVLNRIRSSGIKIDYNCHGDCINVGENLIAINGTVKELVDTRYDSLPHKRMMLSPYLNTAGIGQYKGSKNLVLSCIKK